MKVIRLILLSALATLLMFSAYVFSQQPYFFCYREHAGFAMRRGYYRSYSLRFCDGLSPVPQPDGTIKWVPCVAVSVPATPERLAHTEIQLRSYRFPKFEHTVLRRKDGTL